MIEVILKKWENSIAFVIPDRIIKERNLKENDTILIEAVEKVKEKEDIELTLKDFRKKYKK